LARRELARRSLLDFTLATRPGYQVGWIHKEVTDLLDAFIEAVERRLSPRLIIQLPPRHGKSEIVSRRFPAYLLGKHPEWEVVCATYNQDLADDLGRDVRALMHEPLYNDLFPETTLRKDSNSVSYMKTPQGGSYTSVGIGGALVGRGLHVGIIDDPVKNREDADSALIREATWKWYQSVFRTRAAPGAGIVVLQTRWHEDDLAGKIQLQAQENEKGDRWHVYSYPAIATQDEPHRKTNEALHPERWPATELLTLKNTVDAREWSALYQQNPVPLEGLLLKRDWQHWERPAPKAKLNWYITTDFAIGEKSTNDYTVLWPFAVDDADNIYFGPAVRGRWPAGDIIEKLCDLCDTYKPVQIAIENVHISKTFGPFLKKRMQERRLYVPLWDFTQTRDKVARSASLRGRMQQGKVFLDPVCRPDVEPEFLAFPAGRHDDLVDAASCGMLMLDTLLTAPGQPKPKEEAAPKWSMEWMKLRIAQSSADDRSHVPRHLNGKVREKPAPREKKTSWR
jgi:predicted phage terminase large subunit-like protein